MRFGEKSYKNLIILGEKIGLHFDDSTAIFKLHYFFFWVSLDVVVVFVIPMFVI